MMDTLVDGGFPFLQSRFRIIGPSKENWLVILKTQKHPCYTQVHSPFHWEGPRSLGILVFFVFVARDRCEIYPETG